MIESRSKRIGDILRENVFLEAFALIAILCVAAGSVPIGAIPEIEDFRLLLTLFALVVSVEMIRESGLLDLAVRRAVSRFSSARSLTFALVFSSGVLASLVTNDVALFVVIPFTVAAARHSNFRVRNCVILEIVAVNLLGCLTPLGNPQNLFVYHLSGWSPLVFVRTMAPFCAAMLALLFAAIFAMEPHRGVERVESGPNPPRPAIAAAGLAGIALVILEIFHLLPAWIAAAAALALAMVLARASLSFSSLSIVPLFFFVFIDMAGLRALHLDRLLLRIPLPAGPRLYLLGTLLSQAISNVPAGILLAPLSEGKYRTLLYALNAGGCGTIIASLANLLGWQIYTREAGRDPVFFRRFTGVNVLFLLSAGVAGYWLGIK